MTIGKRLAPQKTSRTPTERSVQDRVIDACKTHWLAAYPQGQAVRGVRIPESSAVDLLLLHPKEGALVLIARSSAHAAAFAHIVGQVVGDVAHLLQLPPQRAGELMIVDPTADAEAHRRLVTRIQTDGAAGDLGIVFAVGFEEHEVDEQVKRRLFPVASLLGRWAAAGVPGLKRGVHLWSVKLTTGNIDAQDMSAPPPEKKTRKKG